MPVTVAVKGAKIDQAGKSVNVGLLAPVSISPTGMGVIHRDMQIASGGGTPIFDGTISFQVKTGISELTVVNKSSIDSITLYWYTASVAANLIIMLIPPNGIFISQDVLATKLINAISTGTSCPVEVVIVGY